MAKFTPQQIAQALQAAGMNRTPSAQDIANANKYGLGIFGATRNRIINQPGQITPIPTPETPKAPDDDPLKAFIDQIRPMLTPAVKSNIQPFEQSGYWNEGDVKAAADQEWDPYYAEEKTYQDTQNAAQDKNTLETVNAAGGLRSSAYDQEKALREQALQRASQEMDTNKRTAKEQFVTNRRGEAYQRYMQAITAATA